MNRKLKHQAAGLLLAGSLICLSGCGHKWILENSSTETKDVAIENVTEGYDAEIDTEFVTEEIMETEDGIFYQKTEKYFPFFQGNWTVVEYAGMISDYHFDETHEEGYMEEEQRHTEEVIAESMGTEFSIIKENLGLFEPLCELPVVIEDNASLFFITRYIPGEFIDLTPPYIGVRIELKDKDDWYDFIADADGTVLVKIKGRFFRLKKKEE